MIYHVNVNAAPGGIGTAERPFARIQQAAAIARPGDEVRVYPGVYREAVSPAYAGTPEARITYRSTQVGGAHITGAESWTDWKRVEGSLWKAVVPNSFFTDRNPFTTMVSGDWFDASFIAHTGDVFLDGWSLYEVADLEGVRNPVPSKIAWQQKYSVYTWYTEQDAETNETVIYANFGGADPTKEKVEINVAAGAKLALDYIGTNTASTVRYAGRSVTGDINAETCPDFVTGVGSLFVLPKGTLILFR